MRKECVGEMHEERMCRRNVWGKDAQEKCMGKGCRGEMYGERMLIEMFGDRMYRRNLQGKNIWEKFSGKGCMGEMYEERMQRRKVWGKDVYIYIGEMYEERMFRINVWGEDAQKKCMGKLFREWGFNAIQCQAFPLLSRTALSPLPPSYFFGWTDLSRCHWRQ